MVCEVWWARVGDIAPGHDALLSEEELARRARFARDGDHARFTAGVAVTRLVLGALLDTSPGSLRFDRRCARCGAAHGKPWLPARPDVQWSVSHAGQWVLVAVHRGPALGVDIEQVRELPGDELGELADYALARSERHR
jgi:4'-phosphopantetheinyl transferase